MPQESGQYVELMLARNFKAMGISIDQIAQATGLTKEQVLAL